MASWNTPEIGAAVPLTVTLTPARDDGRGIELATVLLAAKFLPKIEASDPGATAPCVKLAEFTTPRVESIVGAGGPGATTTKLRAFDCWLSGFVTRIAN